MRIGLDAKWYFSGNPSGKVVVMNIVDEIVKMNTEHEFILFFQKKDQSLAKSFEEKCLDKKHIKIVYCKSLVNFLSNIFIIPFYAKRHKVDVCMMQNFTPFLFHKQIKYVAYIHDFLFFDFPQYYSKTERLVFSLMKYTAKYARKIITISNSEKERIARYSKRDLDNISVVYHGVSDEFTEKSALDKTLDLPKDYLLYIGRINLRKNIQIILESLSSFEGDQKLVIIGKKDHKTFDIEQKIKELKIENKVILLGHVDFDTLISVLQHSKLFIFPSFAEGFGLPPLEAMKAGVPVVCSNSTCLPEVCGDAAILFDPNKKEALIEAVSKALKEKSNLVTKGKKHLENFTWKNSVNNIISIITNIA